MPISEETHHLSKQISKKSYGKCEFCNKTVQNLESHIKVKHKKKKK